MKSDNIIDKNLISGPEVSSYILRQKASVDGLIPTGWGVYFLILYKDGMESHPYEIALQRGASDIAYIGYSGQMGVNPQERLRNIRDNDSSTNEHIRNNIRRIFHDKSVLVKLGWIPVSGEEDAKQLRRELRQQFIKDHAQLPPWNR